MEYQLGESILDLLACPNDGGRLAYAAGSLKCILCGRTYEIRGGIPLLYPDDIYTAHLEEEEKLGGLMENRTPMKEEEFYQRQWELSKEEFWSFVREKNEEAWTILNVGCGIDTRFLELGGKNTTVAFDLTHSLLYSLMTDHGSPNNIAGDVHCLPFRHGSFDSVCCIDLLHHETEGMGEILRSFYDTLKPGGRLFLEDVNAWGLFQFWKSILMPEPVYRNLRSLYHRMKGSPVHPASYEFPTSVWKVMRILEKSGFRNIEAVPLRSYPVRDTRLNRIYNSISSIERVRKYHNFHYFLYAEKPGQG